MEEQNLNDYRMDDDELIEVRDEIAKDQETHEQSELELLNDRYKRLYADFENFRKRTNKDKEDLIKYGNESLLYELLPAIDHLELALKHATGDTRNGLIQGVEITLKELQRTLEKFGLTRVESVGRKFDPSVHHAMSQVEREDMEEKMVAEEFRAGYRYGSKVLRPSLVAVSVNPRRTDIKCESESSENSDLDSIDIKLNKNSEEEEE